MKTSAYVIDRNTNKYLLDNFGNHLSVGVIDALALRDDPKSYRKQIHESRVYMGRNPNADKRVELTPRKGESPHYSYAQGVTAIRDKSYDETFSHE